MRFVAGDFSLLVEPLRALTRHPHMSHGVDALSSGLTSVVPALRAEGKLRHRAPRRLFLLPVPMVLRRHGGAFQRMAIGRKRRITMAVVYFGREDKR